MRYVIGGAICIVILFIVAIIIFNRTTITTQEIDDLIRKEIPLGTKDYQVISFLDAKNIPHSTYGKVIYARVRNTSRRFIMRGDIVIEFIMNEEGRLTSYKIKEEWTGL